MKISILSIAQELLAIPTAPFKEHFIRNHIINFCETRNLLFTQDDFGNLIVKPSKKAARNALAFVAHMDHPGFIIEKMAGKNNASALFYGGWDPEQFKAAPIKINSSGKAVNANALSWTKSRKERSRRVLLEVSDTVHPGDLGMWDFEPFKIENDILSSRCCDDLVGCTLILALIDAQLKTASDISFYAVFTVAEEAGLHGAKYICTNNLLPKNTVPISIETSRELPVAPIGKGIVIRTGDFQSIFSPDITSFMVDSARNLSKHDKHFQFQRKLMDGGTCEGTVFYQFGYRTGGLSVPLGNYHNRNFSNGFTEPEYVSITDLENGAKLMLSLINNSELLSIKPTIPKYTEYNGTLGQKFLLE
jgi:endoglucanase